MNKLHYVKVKQQFGNADTILPLDHEAIGMTKELPVLPTGL